MCPTTLVCTIKFTEDGLDRQKGDQFSVFNFHLPSNVQVGCGSWFISGLPGIYSQAANDEPQGTAVLAAGAWEYTRKMPQRWYSWRTAPVKSPCFFSPWVASITCNSTTYIYIWYIYIYDIYIYKLYPFYNLFLGGVFMVVGQTNRVNWLGIFYLVELWRSQQKAIDVEGWSLWYHARRKTWWTLLQWYWYWYIYICIDIIYYM